MNLEREQPTNPEILPPPSPQFAYWLGFMSGAGNIDLRAGVINYSKIDETYVDKYSEITQNLFGIEGTKTFKERERKQKLYSIYFFNSNLVRKIGDLSKDSWHQTLKEKHGWIYEKTDASLMFINGYFDSRGTIHLPSKSDHHYRISLACNSLTGSETLLSLLQFVGLEVNDIKRNSNRSSGIAGIYIANKKQVVNFALMIRSRFEEKENLLKIFRSIELYDMDQAYQLVMSVYKKERKINNRLGAVTLLKHPAIQSNFPWLKMSTVEKWIYEEKKPRKFRQPPETITSDKRYVFNILRNSELHFYLSHYYSDKEIDVLELKFAEVLSNQGVCDDLSIGEEVSKLIKLGPYGWEKFISQE